MAEPAGSVATRLSTSVNGNSFRNVNLTRFLKGSSELRICSTQNFSIGEFPITIASVLVRGWTRRIFSTTAGKLTEIATTVSLGGRLGLEALRSSTSVSNSGVERNSDG